MYCAEQIHHTGEVRRAKPSRLGSSRVEITMSTLPRCKSSIRNGLRPTSISRRKRGAERAMWLRIGGKIVSAMSCGDPMRSTPLRLLSRRELKASSFRESICRACRSNCRPGSVRCFWRPCLRNSVTPTCCSKRCMCCVTDDWVRARCTPASAKLW